MDRHGRLAPAALVVSALTMALVIGFDTQLGNAALVGLVLTSCAAFVTMTIAERRHPTLTIKFVSAVVIAETAVSLLVMPRATGDLWWYAIYGRIVAVYHASPYTHVPATFPSRPAARLGRSRVVARAVGLRALVHRCLQPRVLRARHRGAADASLLPGPRRRGPRHRVRDHLAAHTLRRRGGVPCLQPGRRAVPRQRRAQRHHRRGRAAGRRRARVPRTRHRGGDRPRPGCPHQAHRCGRPRRAGRVDVRRARGRRPASKTAFASVGVVVLGYAVAGTAALFTPLDTAGARFSAGSLWRLLPRLGRSLPSTHVVLAVLAVLVLLVITRSARRGPAIAVTAAVATLSAGAAYTLAGYVGWALPTAALDHESKVARLAAAEAVLLVAVYQVLRHPFPGWIGTSLMNVAEIGGPLGMLVILVLLVRAARPPADAEPDTSPDGRLTWAREPRTLVVIPTLDERANIEAVLRSTRAALPDAHVLIVDDGSRDGTPEAATALGRELGGIDVVRRVGERGLGSAYRAGFAAGLADGYDVLVEMDADLSHDPHALPSLVDGVRAGADLVIGSRYVRGGATPGWSPMRRALSRGGCWYARHMLTLPVRDATSGFRAYRADALRRIDLDDRRSERLRVPDRDGVPRRPRLAAGSSRCRSCSATASRARRRCRWRSWWKRSRSSRGGESMIGLAASRRPWPSPPASPRCGREAATPLPKPRRPPPITRVVRDRASTLTVHDQGRVPRAARHVRGGGTPHAARPRGRGGSAVPRRADG